MLVSIIGMAVWLIFVVLLARDVRDVEAGSQPGRRERTQDWIELALLVVGLLAVPHLSASVLWIKGALGAYLLFLLFVPLLLEWLLRQRSLAAIGVQLPQDGPALRAVAVLVALLLLARVGQPLLAGAGLRYTWRGVLANVLVFPYLEEKMFRGVLQTRLKSVLGSPASWLVSGLLFGLYHLYGNYLVPGRPLTPEVWASLAYLTAFGMLLGVIAARTRSILPSFVVHLANNR
jgi:membrane protease YdiL (CAAX protease family)